MKGELSCRRDAGSCRLAADCNFGWGSRGKKNLRIFTRVSSPSRYGWGGGGPRLSLTAVQGTGTTCIFSLGVVLQACLGYTGTKLAPDIP